TRFPLPLYALDDAFAEQALRPDQQEQQRQYVGEPDFDAAAHHRPQEHLGYLLAGADDQPADDRPRHRGEAAQDQHRQRLQRQQRERELDAELAAPHRARRQRHHPADQPDDEPDLGQRNADRLGGGMVGG